MKIKLSFAFFLCLLLNSLGAKAEPENSISFSPPAAWSVQAEVEKIATFRIGRQLDTYRIPLRNCGANVLAVNLKISQAIIVVQDIGVRFTDGNFRQFSINRTFYPGNESGWIDLDLFRSIDPRCPTEVFARARAEGGVGKVEVFGRMR